MKSTDVNELNIYQMYAPVHYELRDTQPITQHILHAVMKTE